MPASTSHGSVSPFYARELGAMRKRVARALEAFKLGEMILVGDDGRRENEADLVFHAAAATAEKVNFAITHARGLLCVSVGHDLADTLAFPSAPRLPGAVAHTGFTLSVDARDGITSGISASDRAHTIRLMGNPRAQPADFISPGHVFPVRANSGGLLARSGHTEALLELCQAAGMVPAAAMCEILAADGEALRPHDFLKSPSEGANSYEMLRVLPYLSTVDLLWNRVFYGNTAASHWSRQTEFPFAEGTRAPRESWVLEQGLEEHISLPAALHFWQDFTPETLRITVSNGLSEWNNGVETSKACGQLSLVSFAAISAPLEGALHTFCDLSGKEGIRGTLAPVRRVVSQLRAIEFLQRHCGQDQPLSHLMEKMKFPFEEDKDFLRSVFTL